MRPTVNGVKKVPFPNDLREAARGLLDDRDSFVLSKIVPAMVSGDQQASFDKLLEIAWKNRSIRDEILPKLTNAAGKMKPPPNSWWLALLPTRQRTECSRSKRCLD